MDDRGREKAETGTAGGPELWNDDTLTGLLARWAEDRPDSPAILTDRETVTYAGLSRRVASLAGPSPISGWRRATGWACICPTSRSS